MSTPDTGHQPGAGEITKDFAQTPLAPIRVADITDYIRAGKREYPAGPEITPFDPAGMLTEEGTASGENPEDVKRNVDNLNTLLRNAIERPDTFGRDWYGPQRDMLGMLLERAGITRPNDGRRVRVASIGGPLLDHRTEPGVAPPERPSYRISI